MPAKQFVPAFSLGVVTVLNLNPAVPVILVDAELSFRNDALQISCTDLRDELFPILLNVLRVQDAAATARLGK